MYTTGVWGEPHRTHTSCNRERWRLLTQLRREHTPRHAPMFSASTHCLTEPRTRHRESWPRPLPLTLHGSALAALRNFPDTFGCYFCPAESCTYSRLHRGWRVPGTSLITRHPTAERCTKWPAVGFRLGTSLSILWEMAGTHSLTLGLHWDIAVFYWYRLMYRILYWETK